MLQILPVPNKLFAVLIAFTNHAVDHLVSSILDDNITNDLVRLGSRSTNDRVLPYTLDNLEGVETASMLDQSVRRQRNQVKYAEQELKKRMRLIQSPSLEWSDLASFIRVQYPDHAGHFSAPPEWIAAFQSAELERRGEDDDLKSKGRLLYTIWREGLDLNLLSDALAEQARSSMTTSFDAPATQFLKPFGFRTQLPLIPSSERTNQELQSVNVWSMSLIERAQLSSEWEVRVRDMASQQYEPMLKEYKEECRAYRDMRNEVRVLLSDTR